MTEKRLLQGAVVLAGLVPVLAGAREHLAAGIAPEGTRRNQETFGARMRSSVPAREVTLMCDAQTSGGLLIAVQPDKAGDLERRFGESGLFYAKIGTMTAGDPVVTLIP